MKLFYLTALFLISPLFVFADGQSGLGLVFFIVLIVPLLIQGLLGGMLIYQILININKPAKLIYSMIVSFFLTIILANISDLFFRYKLILFYLSALLAICIITLFIKKQKKN